MSTIQKNIRTIQQEISEACSRVGRKPEEITLMAVTKNRSIGEIQEVLDSGITVIGENRIQEAEQKFSQMDKVADILSKPNSSSSHSKPLKPTATSKPNPLSKFQKHFIGHLQSNKINKALELFDIIHAIDSIELAEKINSRAKLIGRKIPVFLEVNTSDEPQKYGFPIEKLDESFQEIHFMENIDVVGFMTIPKNTDNESVLRHSFDMLHDTRDFIKNKHFLDTQLSLSMGMSNDFEIAIEQGTDIVRIGRRIFE